MLTDVQGWCPHAFFTEGFKAAAAGNRARGGKMLGKLDYENHMRWTMCCAAARGLFG